MRSLAGLSSVLLRRKRLRSHIKLSECIAIKNQRRILWRYQVSNSFVFMGPKRKFTKQNSPSKIRTKNEMIEKNGEARDKIFLIFAHQIFRRFPWLRRRWGSKKLQLHIHYLKMLHAFVRHTWFSSNV